MSEVQEKMIDKQTLLFGLLADQASKSKIPRYFQQSFAQRNVNARYIPMNIREDDIYFTVSGLKRSQISAVNIDPEYGKIVFDLIDEVDSESMLAGFVNSIKIRDGRLYGSITVSKAIYQLIGQYNTIGIIGLGALAKSLIFHAKEYGIKKIVLYHEMVEKIADFIDRYSEILEGIEVDIRRSASTMELDSSGINVLINATPYGKYAHEKLFLSANVRDMILIDAYSGLFIGETFFSQLGQIQGNRYIGNDLIEQEQQFIDVKEWIDD